LDQAGNIFVDIDGTLQANNGTILTIANPGGGIDITAKDIRLQGDSDITTSVFRGQWWGVLT